MIKTFAYIVLFYLLINNLLSQSLSVFSIDGSEFPLMKAKFLAVDKDGKKINDLTPIDIILNESNKIIPVTNVECHNDLDNPQKISSVLLIDISGSMKGNGLKIADSSASVWINLMPDIPQDEIECSVCAFNENSYLIQDFTQDKQKLTNAIKQLIPEGGTSYNEAFLGNPDGACNIATKARYKPIIIFLTDGDAPGNEEKIVSKANAINASIYCITMNIYAPDILKNIASRTGGVCFENINSENDMKEAYRVIYQLSRGFQPCDVMWVSSGCDQIRHLILNIPNPKYNLSTMADYFLIDTNLPFIEYSLSDGTKQNYLDFAVVPMGNIDTKKLNITARKSDLIISEIKSSDTHFSIINYGGISPPFTLTKDLTKELTIQFVSTDTNYIFSDFKVLSSACGDNDFIASAGSKEKVIPNKTLMVTFPNGNEKILAGLDTSIRWSGVLQTDTVKLEFSPDSGKSWQKITDSANGLKYIWKAPGSESKTCLIKASQLSLKDDFYKVKLLKGHIGKIYTDSWSPDGSKMVSGSDDGNIKMWDIPNNKVLKEIDSGQGYHPVTIWSPDNNKFVYSKKDNFLIIRDPFSENRDSLSHSDDIINTISWSPDNKFIAAGGLTGNIYIWQLPAKLPVKSFQAHTAPITKIQWRNNFLVSSSYDSTVKFWNVADYSAYLPTLAFTGKVYSFSMNPNNDKIAVGTDLKDIPVWNLKNNIKDFILKCDNVPVYCLEWNPVSNYIAAACADSTVKVWESVNGWFIYNYFFHFDVVNDIKWNSNGDSIASCGNDKRIHIWALKDLPFEKIPLQSDTSDSLFSIIRPKLVTNNFNFGKVIIGTELEISASNLVLNPTDVDLKIDSIKIEGNRSGEFSFVSNTYNLLIPSGSVLNPEIRVNPVSQAGFYSLNLNIYTKFGIFNSNLSGEAVSSMLVISDDNIDFGQVNLDEIKSSKDILIKNIGSNSESINFDFFNPVSSPFSIKNGSPSFTLQPGEESTFSLNFAPQDIGCTSGYLLVNFSALPYPLKINLYGEGTQPVINVISDIKLPALLCGTNPVDTVISISNTGSGVLKISSASITGADSDEFTISNLSNVQIQPNNSNTFQISFASKSVGDKSADIYLFTNLTSNSGVKSKLILSAKKDSSALNLMKSMVQFQDLNEDTPAYDSITIQNSGTLPLYLPSPVEIGDFSLSISPLPVQPNSNSIVYIIFKGGKFGPYSNNYNFTDLCGRISKLNMIANVGKNDARIQTVSAFTFTPVICNDAPIDSNININNSGTTSLAINSVTLTNNINNEFSLLNDLSNSFILPNAKESLKVRFSPSGTGEKTAFIEIFSNGINTVGGKTRIDLSARKDTSVIELSKDSSNFKNINEFASYHDTVTISNNGTIPVTWNFPVSLNKFTIDSLSPKIINPNSSSKLYMTFKGGQQGEVFSSTYNLQDLCGNQHTLDFFASVSSAPYLYLNTINDSAAQGEDIEIPVYLFNPHKLNLINVTQINTSLSFNATLLVPENGTPDGNTINNTRIIPLNLPPIPDNSFPVNKLKFKVTLGNAYYTSLDFSTPVAVGDNTISIIASSGTFRLKANPNGETPIIGDSGILYLNQNFPNPLNNKATIEFYLIEDGYIDLSLYDLMGRKMASLESGFFKAGKYPKEYDFSNYSTGTYFYVLNTPTATILKKMQIIR